MNNIEKSKRYYDEIEIPKELEQVVDNAIGTASKKRASKKKAPIFKIIECIGAVAASIVIIIAIGVNSNEAFAESMEGVPIIGKVVKVLTVRSYVRQEDNINIDVEVPEVQDTKSAFVGDVNAEIQKIADKYVADAEQRVAEYKEAFLATGGTEEEWNKRGIDIKVYYDIKYQDDNKVSFVLSGNESWVSFSAIQVYYNLDLINNKKLNLQDVLGDNYVNIANEQIVKQINQRIQDNGMIYWGFNSDTMMNDEGFKTVDADTQFYINEAGNVVVAFDKYSIGPGYIGVQEFEIIK